MDSMACSISDAAKMLGLGRSFVYELLAQKRLRAVKSGSRTLVLTDSIRDYLDGLPPAEISGRVRERRRRVAAQIQPEQAA